MKDVHIHIFSSDVKENRDKYLTDEHFALLYANEKSRIADLDSIRKEYGDETALILLSFAWKKNEFLERENLFLGSLIPHLPASMRIFGMVATDEQDVYSAVNRLKQNGFSGIGEIAFYDGFVDYEFLDSLCTAAGALGLPVNLHLNEPFGRNYPGKYVTSFEKIYDIIKRNPETIIILSHLGGGFFVWEGIPEIKETLKNVYYDIAAVPYIYEKGFLEQALTIVPEKIIFGSDFPLLKTGRYLDHENEQTMKKIQINTDRFLSKTFTS